MQYTKNYHLPQWVKTDRIMMDDFNAAMSAMENGMTASDEKSENALSTANTANTLASAAKQTADAAYSPGQKPYVVGSYTGTGSTMHIDLGFRPSLVIVSGMQGTTAINSSASWIASFAISGGNALKDRLEIDNTGFSVYPRGYKSYQDPSFADLNMVFDYIAFK